MKSKLPLKMMVVLFLYGCAGTSQPPAALRDPTAEELERYAPEAMSPEKRELLKQMAKKAAIDESQKAVISYNEESFDPSFRYEKVPEELSVAHFAKMKLYGGDFRVEKTLTEDPAFVRHAISYDSNGLRISGVLLIPTGAGPFPLIVAGHGYIDPEVYSRGRGLKREEESLARSGFAVLHPDYRGHADSDPSPDTRKVYDAGLEYSMDVANAVEAIRMAKLPGIDTGSVGMIGHSMGGGIALNIAVARPELFDAFVLYAPVSGDAWRNFERWKDERESDDRTMEVLGDATENASAWLKLSSATRLSEVKSPILIVHGDKDADVPIEWSRELFAALIRLRKNARLIELTGEKHEFITRFDEFMKETTAFFRQNL